MANTLSGFVEDEDIAGFIPGFPAVAASNRAQLRTAKGIDALFKKELGRTYVTSNVSELIDVHREQTWHGQIIRPVAMLMLTEYPVSSFTKLEQITGFTITGAVDTATEIAKSEYQVDLAAGIIKLLGQVPESDVMAQVLGANSLWSFPAGATSMRATYVAGLAVASIPDDLKLAWLIEFSKYWKMRQNDRWSEENIEGGQFGNITLVRAGFAPETIDILKKHGKRPLMSAQGPY